MFMALIGAIPVLGQIVTSIMTSFFNARVNMYTARTGVSRDVAVAAIQAQIADNQAKAGWITALASNPIMMLIVVGFALPFIVFEWKCVVIDIVWMGGTTSTPPIKGQLADWANVILGGIFISSTGMGVAHAIVNRLK